VGNPKHIGRVGALAVALGVASTVAMAVSPAFSAARRRWGGDRRILIGPIVASLFVLDGQLLGRGLE